MTRDQGKGRNGWTGRLAGRWAGVVVGALLAVGGPAMAFQSRTTVPAATPGPSAGGPKTYADCLHDYAYRRDVATTCARLFPAAAAPATAAYPAAPPVATAPTPSAPTPTAAPSTPAAATPTREPVDITPQLNRLIDAWKNRPKPASETPRPPADPLAVIPDIQAACAAYADVPERWRRCTTDGWRTAGLRGQPPLELRNPPVVEPPPPPPPPVQPPPVVSRPPVETPPPLAPTTVTTEPVRPAPVVAPTPPPAATVQPPATPPAAVPPSPPSKSTSVWFWLLALVAAAGAGFGLAKLLSRARTPSPTVCTPDIALVADPGVVTLRPDGPPRAGMAVSLRVARDADGGQVRLDYPSLETAP